MRLVRQLLIESLVLSFAGGLAGIVLAVGMTRGLIALVPAEGNPLLIRPEPDGRILLFTLGLTFLTSLIFGLVPALRASRPDLWTTLKDAVGSIAGKGGSLLLRKGLVTAQVALSFLLLFGAGLANANVLFIVAGPFGVAYVGPGLVFSATPVLLHSGPLSDFGPVPIFNILSTTPLPSGSYYWFMAVQDTDSGEVSADVVQTEHAESVVERGGSRLGGISATPSGGLERVEELLLRRIEERSKAHEPDQLGATLLRELPEAAVPGCEARLAARDFLLDPLARDAQVVQQVSSDIGIGEERVEQL